MVNCNPETVSTDYDTSDRLYFEPLDDGGGARDLRARAARRRRDPVRRPDAAQARAGDRGGRLPRSSARRSTRSTSPRTASGSASCSPTSASAARSGGSRRAPTRRPRSPTGSATRCSCGRRTCSAAAAMRVCYSRGAGASRHSRRARADARRPLPRERDRDRRRRALRRRDDLRRRGHAARRGGRRPLRRLLLRAAGAVARRRSARRRSPRSSAARAGARRRRAAQRPARGRRTTTCTCSRSIRAPRARCRSPRKATGVNLVEAACRLAAGATIAELGLPPSGRRARYSVKAAVLPFARFPGADPVLGPEMRSTGEVMASASDLPTALREGRARRRPAAARGRRRPSSRSATPTRRRPSRSRRRSPGSASELVATAARPRTLRGAGLEVDEVRKVGEAGRGADGRRPDPPRPLRPRRQHARRGSGARTRRLPDPRGRARRPRPVHHDDRRRRGGGRRRSPTPAPRPLLAPGAHRERIDVEASRARVVSGCESRRRGGRAVHARSGVERGGLDPGIPGQFFMLEAPGHVLPRPFSLCLAPRGRAWLPDRSDRPRHARALRARARRGDPRLRTARQRLPARRRPAAARRRRHRHRAASRISRRRSSTRRRCSASARGATPRRPRSCRTPRS